MSFTLFGRPKWKHPDPQVRSEAVAQLTDEAALAEVAQTDASREIRFLAVKRISESERLLEVACGKTEVNLEALNRLADQAAIAEVARRAESAEVRGRAVERMENDTAVQRISTQDPHPMVRIRASMKLGGQETLREFLRVVLASLQVPPFPLAQPPEGDATNLDGVCDALANERRFRIQGVIGEVKQPDATPLGVLTRSPIVSRFGPDQSLGVGRCALQLLGSKIPDPAEKDSGRVSSYFQIEIRRTGPDAYNLNVKERPVN